MNNKMKLGIAMMLTASLTVALLSIPSKVAIAQAPPENQTMQSNANSNGGHRNDINRYSTKRTGKVKSSTTC